LSSVLEKTNVQLKADKWEISILFSLFILLRSSSNWMRPTHISKGNLLYLRPLVKNSLTDTPRIMLKQMFGDHSLFMLTPKTHHQKNLPRFLPWVPSTMETM
jgi:hypothetical protein